MVYLHQRDIVHRDLKSSNGKKVAPNSLSSSQFVYIFTAKLQCDIVCCWVCVVLASMMRIVSLVPSVVLTSALKAKVMINTELCGVRISNVPIIGYQYWADNHLPGDKI